MTPLSRLCQIHAAHARRGSPQTAMLAVLAEYDEMKARGESVNPCDSTPEHVLDLVGVRFSVPTKAIVGPSRARVHVRPRAVAAWALRNTLGMSTTGVGHVLGRDHTSTMHLCRLVERDLELLAVARGIAAQFGPP